jgi:hypothetical protein
MTFQPTVEADSQATQEGKNPLRAQDDLGKRGGKKTEIARLDLPDPRAQEEFPKFHFGKEMLLGGIRSIQFLTEAPQRLKKRVVIQRFPNDDPRRGPGDPHYGLHDFIQLAHVMQGSIGQDDIGYAARQPFRFDGIMDEEDLPLPPVELFRDPDHLPGLIDADIAPVQAVKVTGGRSDAATDFDQDECRLRVLQHRIQRIPELRLTGDRRRRIRVLSDIGGGNPVKKCPILLFPGKGVV